jgi:hypothetical protein
LRKMRKDWTMQRSARKVLKPPEKSIIADYNQSDNVFDKHAPQTSCQILR